jgi:hypothetical protein
VPPSSGNLTGNIIGQDPNLGLLASNGGPTQTHALLLSGTLSPALDAADPGNFPATDQRGVARPLNGDTVAGALPDIGSFELVLPTAAPVTISGFVRVNKRGLRGATVILSDLDGNQISTETGSSGRFSFTDLDSGQTYIVYVMSRNYDFEPQTVTAEDNVEDLLFEITPGRGPNKPGKP